MSVEPIRPCPACGMPRHRHRTRHGWRWSPCGPCHLFASTVEGG